MADINWADFKPAPDQDVSALVGAITHVESGGNTDAVSSQGATGSMQITPATFQQYAAPGQTDYANDAHRRAAAIHKIVDDYVHFGGDLSKTAASYIGGRGAVRPDGTIRDDVADANGTTPAAYAQTVLGRMKATPKIDWSQFTPVPDTGAGRGAINPPVVDPNAPEPTAPVGTAYQPPEPNTDPETATGGPEILQALQANPDAGAGRGSVNPPDAVPLVPGNTLSSVASSVGRGYGRAGAETALWPSLLASASGVAWDALHSAVSGKTETGAQDWMFRNLVDPRQQAVDWYAVPADQKQGFLDKVADSLGAMAQDLPTMIASGGAKQRMELAQQFPTMARYLENAFSSGFDAMRPIMVKAGAQKAQQVLEAGGTPAQAMNSATVTALWTGLSGGQPMSAEGKLLQRMATGVPVGMAQEEAGRVVQNAADPDQMQRPFDAAEMAAGGATNAIAAGVLPHAGQEHAHADRADLSRAEPAHDPVEEVMSAPTVEAAAAAAAKLASAPSTPDVANIMRGIRPSNPVDLEGSPDERQPAEIPPAAAGADGAGGADAAAGVGPGPGADDLQRPPVEPGGPEGEAEAGVAHVADAGSAAPVERDPIGEVRPGLEREDALEEQGALFKRGDAQGGPAAKLTQISDVVSNLTRDWLRKPDIHVLGSMDEAPEPVRRVMQQQNSHGALGTVEGFHWRGGVYLVGDALHSPADVQRVLLHETAHFGLRGVFGESLRPILDEVSGAMPVEVRRKALQYGLDYTDPQQRRIASEEVLAELAQTRPELSVVQRAVAAIRTWLRAHGIVESKMTQDEIIRNYIMPARGWVERGRAASTSDEVRFHRAFHGTPHDFDRFSTEHIGSGEGAQAYGHGLYFAEHEGVADTYRKTLSGGVLLDGKAINGRTGPMEQFMADMFKNRKAAGLSDEKAREQTAQWAKQHFQIKELGDAKIDDFVGRMSMNQGSLYQVHIPDEAVARMLHWDKPLSEQPQYVQQALKFPRKKGLLEKIIVGDMNTDHEVFGVRMDKTGKDLYEAIATRLADHRQEPEKDGVPRGWGGFVQTFNDKVVNHKAASEYLDSIGIPGIRYLDGQSRNRPLKDIKREFLRELPEDADFSDVQDLIGTGTFSPKNEAILKALKADDWLGFDYPAQALSAALGGHIGNYDASPALHKAIEDAQVDATHNLVVFNDKNVQVTHKNGQPVSQAERADYLQDPDLPRFSRAEEQRPERDPDAMFSRTGTTAATAGMPPTAPTRGWERAKSVLSDLIDEGLSRAGVYRMVSPMSEGSVRARMVAQNFANAERLARDQWGRISTELEKHFTPEQRRQMWEAADEQNTLMQQGQATAGRGLERLSPEQRDAVEQLHTYGEELLRRAKNAGMFQGEGLPYWTPRMMVMLDEHGEFTKPTEPGKKATSGGEGRNVFTTSGNLKQRKYLSVEETEAAMKAKGGELVRDIMTMPLAMDRLERAIAGRELINQIKELGASTGEPTVLDGRPDHEGFFTLDHPSFTTFRPRFERNEDTGKLSALQDQNGKVVFDRVPLYMSKEFEGPVKAILSNTDGNIYKALMLLKSKAMSAIMFSPLIHNMVIFGRALGYDPTIAGTVGLYFKGHAARQDNEMMRTAIEGGMVPMGYHGNGMLDITDVARGVGKEGGLLDPRESWIAHGARAIVGAVNKDAGAAAKRFVDKAGDLWHGTLLWDRVADLQMGIFAHAYGRLQEKGFEPGVAKVMAAHWANRYAGAIARENMGPWARKAANVLLFSRSFNMGNLGTVKDMFFGMPSGLRAKIEGEYGKAASSQAFTEARRKAWSGFVADAAMSLIALSLAQSVVDRFKKDKSWDDIFGGYMDRASRMWENIKAHPVNPTAYSPWQLSPTHDNEPGKQDRVDMGEIPDQGGRHEYMRLPTGKVVEDLFNWTSHPAQTFANKMSPLARGAMQWIANDKGFGVPVYDPNGSVGQAAVDVAAHLAKSETPWDTIVTLWDKLHGKTTAVENDKLVGNMTGFSYSQGHPGGPDAGVAADVEQRIQAQKMLAMEDVKRLLRYGQDDLAREKLEGIGLSPREVTQIIKHIEQPAEGMTRNQQKRFNQHSNEDDQRRLDNVTR